MMMIVSVFTVIVSIVIVANHCQRQPSKKKNQQLHQTPISLLIRPISRCENENCIHILAMNGREYACTFRIIIVPGCGSSGSQSVSYINAHMPLQRGMQTGSPVIDIVPLYKRRK